MKNLCAQIATMSRMYGDNDDEDSTIECPEVDLRLDQMKDILRQKIKTINVQTYEEGQNVRYVVLLYIVDILIKKNFFSLLYQIKAPEKLFFY